MIRQSLAILCCSLLLREQCLAAFSYQRRVRIPSGKVSSNLTAFTVVVDITLNAAHVTDSNGYDIGVYANDSCTGKMKWRTANYNSGTGRFVTYVKTDIASASDTDFYLCYGDAGITTKQYTDSEVVDGSTTLWMPADAVSSTTEEIVGSTFSKTDTVATAAGKGYNAFDLTAAGYLSRTGGAPPSAITVALWLKTKTTGAQTKWLVMQANGETKTGWELAFQGQTYLEYNGGSYTKAGCQSTDEADNAWHHFAVTYTGGTTAMYLDGTACSVTGTPDAPGAGTGWTVGAENYGGTFYYKLDGYLDEINVSSTARAVAWIAALYANQNNPTATGGDAFFSFGTEGAPTTPNLRIKAQVNQ